MRDPREGHHQEAALPTSTAQSHGIPDRFIYKGWPVRLLLFIAVAVAAHLLLSRFGFVPMDDGFILAQSRRILDGQVPHRDFISIRPVGSAILHTADLALGGAHAFLLSRLFYWVQAATTCWCWLEIVLGRSSTRPSLLGVAPLIPLSFMLTTHAFWPMAWHTVDGVWLASLGLLACMGPSQRWRLAGYVLVGAGVTCKQNFLPMLPLVVLANGDARRPWAWLAVLAPAVLYVGVISGLGGAGDLRQQLFAFSGLMGPGVEQYLKVLGWPTGLIVGAAASLVAARGAREEVPTAGFGSAFAWGGFLVLLVAVGAIGWSLDASRFLYVDRMSFTLLGCLCGFVLANARRFTAAPLVTSAALLAALGWCSSISYGYQSPAHVAGPMAIVLLLAGPAGSLRAGGSSSRIVMAVLLWIVTLVVSGHWWSARRDHLPNEATAPLLTHRLDGVLAGADGIMASPNTFAVLADLRDLVRRLDGRPYAVVVDAPGWWAGSEQRNPLLSDWPQNIELCNLELQDRFSAHAVSLRGRVVFIVQKVQMSTLAEKFVPVGNLNLYFGAAVWIQHTFRKREDTRYWAVYE